MLGLLAQPTGAQELEPRAYSVAPVGTEFLVVSVGRSVGDVSFDPTLPFEDVSATINVVLFGYYRSLNVFGRSGSVTVSVPVSTGSIQGLVAGEFARAERTGLADPRFRFAMNLVGAPAMSPSDYAGYRQATTLGVSLVVVAPVGQYDSTKLINLGSNRWSFKPEVGLSKRLGRWFVDVYAGAWLFTANDDFVGRRKSQAPLASAQVHLVYSLRPRLWMAFDVNVYTGGRTTIDGVASFDLQRSSRVGGTLSLPLSARQSLKVLASTGAFGSVGADFDSFAVVYQYLLGPR
jgi:hypothetical protein